MAITYLPVEQSDAEETRAKVEAEKRRCLLLAGDLDAGATLLSTTGGRRWHSTSTGGDAGGTPQIFAFPADTNS